jgi:hypothetical protein
MPLPNMTMAVALITVLVGVMRFMAVFPKASHTPTNNNPLNWFRGEHAPRARHRRQSLAQQVEELGDVGRDLSRLVFREQLGCGASAGGHQAV